MPATALDLQARTSRLLAALEAIAPRVTGSARARMLAQTMTRACRAMDAGYRAACASASPEQFVSRMSDAARNAKRTKAALMLLTQLDYTSITDVRNLIIEARALENVFTVSRNAAKRRFRLGTTAGSQR